VDKSKTSITTVLLNKCESSAELPDHADNALKHGLWSVCFTYLTLYNMRI